MSWVWRISLSAFGEEIMMVVAWPILMRILVQFNGVSDDSEKGRSWWKVRNFSASCMQFDKLCCAKERRGRIWIKPISQYLIYLLRQT